MRMLAIGFVVVIAAGQAEAVCGGGFGMNYQPEFPKYVSTAEAQTRAAKHGSGIVFVFQRQQGDLSVWEHGIAKLSQTLPHVNIAFGSDTSLAQRLGVTAVPALVVCDRHGNPLDRLCGTLGTRLVQQLYQRLPALTQQAERQVQERMAQARKALARPNAQREAVALLEPLATLRGYAEAKEAQQLLGELRAVATTAK